jgi:O-antigen ligase
MLKALLFFNLLYVVNEIHFHLATGIPALAPANILFLVILLVMRSKTEVLDASVRGLLRQPLLYFYGALTLAFFISEIRSTEHFLEDLTFFKNALFYPLFYFLYLRCRQDEKTTRRLIIWILVIAAVAGLEGLREGLDYGFGRYNPFHRASGPFGADWHNANRAGVFYAMFMPMFVAIALFLRGKVWWRLAAVGGCILLAGGAVATYSRQAYFLVLLSFVLLLVRKSIIVAVILGVALVSLAGYLPDSVFQRVEDTQTVDKKGNEEIDPSTASRFEIWAAAMNMYRDHPLGVGFHKFSYELGNYAPAFKGFDAHNFYVRTFAESGPLGLLTFLLVVRTLFRITSFVRKNCPPEDSETRALAYGFTIATLCMAMGGLYGTPTLEGAVMAPYWALCGLLERYIHLKLMRGEAAVVEPVAAAPSFAERFPLSAHFFPGRRAAASRPSDSSGP